jgi:hypothetical protein
MSLKSQGQFNLFERGVVLSKYENNPFINYQVIVKYIKISENSIIKLARSRSYINQDQFEFDIQEGSDLKVLFIFCTGMLF